MGAVTTIGVPSREGARFLADPLAYPRQEGTPIFGVPFLEGTPKTIRRKTCVGSRGIPLITDPTGHLRLIGSNAVEQHGAPLEQYQEVGPVPVLSAAMSARVPCNRHHKARDSFAARHQNFRHRYLE
jgi:hypothetical protein